MNDANILNNGKERDTPSKFVNIYSLIIFFIFSYTMISIAVFLLFFFKIPFNLF